MISVMLLPCILSAQTSGVAGDGSVRLMLIGSNSSIRLYSFNNSNTKVATHDYGPFPGWLPIAMTTANNGNTYILWRSVGFPNPDVPIGQIALWLVDTNLDYVSSRPYGPVPGWTAESLSVDTANTNGFRLLLKNPDGKVSIWNVDSALNANAAFEAGPYYVCPPDAACLPSALQTDMGAAAAMKGAVSAAGAPIPKQ
jgi:hypothetical protein